MLRKAWITSKNLGIVAGGLLALFLVLLFDRLFFGPELIDVPLPLLLGLPLALAMVNLVSRNRLASAACV